MSTNIQNDASYECAPITAELFVQLFLARYVGAVKNGTAYGGFRPFMLWGPPGVGKSAVITHEIKDEMERLTGKRVIVTEKRIATEPPTDLIGLPAKAPDGASAVMLHFKDMNLDASEDVVNILFLDELTAALQTVQAGAYQIVQDRRIGTLHFPDNTIIICAGNRVTDRAISYKMPSALANKLSHFNLEADAGVWLRWAKQSGIHPDIIRYIERTPERLYETPSGSDIKAYPTPRSWEGLSHILNNAENSEIAYTDEMLMSEALAHIGSTALDFFAFIQRAAEVPKMADIFGGTNPKPPKKADALGVMINSMIQFAKTHTDSTVLIDNSIEYLYHRVTPEYGYLYIQALQAIDDDAFKARLQSLKSYNRWIARYGKYL